MLIALTKRRKVRKALSLSFWLVMKPNAVLGIIVTVKMDI